MDYLQWNNLLGEHFFGAHDATREITLYITKHQLVSLYKNDAISDNDKWNDFVAAINDTRFLDAGGLNIDGFRNSSIVDKISRLGRRTDSIYPMYLPFLVLFIIAKAENQGNTDAAFYQVIVDFFQQNNLNGVNTSNQAAIIIRFLGGEQQGTNYWEKLSEWSRKGEYGILDVTPIGHRYVGYIRRQCLLSRNQIERLPDFFVRSHVCKDGIYTMEEFRRKIRANTKLFTDEVIKIVKNDQNWRIVTKVIYNYFKNEWDGQGLRRDDNTNRTSRYTVIPLHLCVYLDDNYQNFCVCFRTHTDIDDYDNLKIFYSNPNREFNVIHEQDGWSRELEYSPDIRTLADRKFFIKYNFDFDKEFYVLHPNSLGEYSSLPMPVYEGERLLIAAKNNWEPYEKLERITDYGNNEYFSLYYYTFHQEDNYITENIDTSQIICHIKLEGGLPLKNSHNKFLSTFMPKLVSYDNNDSQTLSMVNENDGEVTQLEPTCNGPVITWEIPNNIGKFIIKTENDEEITKIEICKDNTVDFDDFSGFVRINNRGQYISDDVEGDYFCDNEFFSNNNLEYSFQSRIYRGNNNLDNENEINDYSMGDYLIDWLYFYGKCSRKEFEKAFFFLQQKYVTQNRTNYKDFKNNDIKSTLRILRAGGFIEIDKNRNIIPCRPRFIALPISNNRGNCNIAKFIGCRSIEMMENLKTNCNAFPDCMHYNCLSPVGAYLKFRLCPSTVFVELKGAQDDNFGFSILEEHVCRPQAIKSPDFYFFDKFREFMTSITDYDTEVWPSIDGERKYDDFESRIFNPTSMEYESGDDIPCEFKEFFNYRTEQNFALIKIIRRKYDIVFVLINKYDRRYLEITDEGMGKYYVIHHKIKEILIERQTPNDALLVADANNEIYKDQSVKSTFFEEQNGRLRVRNIDEIAIMKKAGLPRLMDKFLNLITLETPYLCMDIDEYRESCPFLPNNERCNYRKENPCPHRYYLFSTYGEAVSSIFIDMVIKDKLKLKF